MQLMKAEAEAEAEARVKPYWVFSDLREDFPCLCCDAGLAMDGNRWDCSGFNDSWIVVDKEPDFSKPHDIDICVGNCSIHPLLTADMMPLHHPDLYKTTWGDYLAEMEERALAIETPEQKADRLLRKAEALEGERVQQEAVLRQVYSAKMRQASMIGTKKGETKKLDRPCKYMVDPAGNADPSCWAWEYIDPKTKKFMTPHTCIYQHPGEPGWNDAWSLNPQNTLIRPGDTRPGGTRPGDTRLEPEDNRFASLRSYRGRR